MAQRISAVLCADAARLVLAVILVAGTLVLLGFRVEVPNVLWALDGAAIGFYFGGNIPPSGRLGS